MTKAFFNNYIYTKELIEQAEEATFCREDSFAVMCRAAKVCYKYISKILLNGKILILCGPGNNGGDGLLIGENLKALGHSIEIYSPFGCGKTVDSNKALNLLDKSLFISEIKDFSKYDIIVDALFGFQFNKPLNKPIENLINETNASSAKKIAIDIPTGVYCNNGQIDRIAFKADITLTFHRLKPCHVLLPGKEFSGKIELFDIYLDSLDQKSSIQLMPDPLLKRPKLNDHKYNRGELLIFASNEMVGASKLATLIASKVAFKSGVGIVKLLVHQDDIILFKQHILEELILPYRDINEIEKNVKENSTFVFGCGLILNKINKDVLDLILKKKTKIVFDAGSFALMERDKSHYLSLLNNHKGSKVLSPHKNEFGRLFEITNDKIADCRIAAEKSNSVVLYKGNDTVISDNKNTFINYFTSSYLATAGSGDILSGLIGSFLSQGYSPLVAANYACFLHSNSAIKLNRPFSAYELVDQISLLIKQHTK